MFNWTEVDCTTMHQVAAFSRCRRDYVVDDRSPGSLFRFHCGMQRSTLPKASVTTRGGSAVSACHPRADANGRPEPYERA